MPNIPCDNAIRDCDCIGDSPFKNISAEDPDVPSFSSVFFGIQIPPLGTAWDRITCAGLCTSQVSQLAADLCAVERSLTCIGGTWGSDGGGPAGPPVPPPTATLGRTPWRPYGNSEQVGTAECPDGNVFTYTVPENVFFALGPVTPGILTDAAIAQANAEALSAAQQLAEEHLLCLSSIDESVCVNGTYSQTIVATSSFLAQSPQQNFWAVLGDLPPGITANISGFSPSPTLTLSGEPSTTGVYNFSVTIILPNGDFQRKNYTIAVNGITNADALPDGATGNAYSATLQTIGITNPIFSIEGGALPDGLTLDSITGVISGTPTVVDEFEFALGVTEAGTGVTCVSNSSINVISGCVITPDPLPDATEGILYVQQLFPPAGFINPVWSLTSGSLPPGFDDTAYTGFGFLVGTPGEAGTYQLHIRVDADGGMFCEQVKQLVVLPRTPFVWNLAWPAPIIVLFDTGTESHSFAPAGSHTHTDSGPGGNSPLPAVAQINQSNGGTGGGQMLYTGPGLPNNGIKVRVDILLAGANTTWSLEVIQNGFTLISTDQSLSVGSGTFYFFSFLNAGVNSPIQVCTNQECDGLPFNTPSPPSIVDMVVTLS